MVVRKVKKLIFHSSRVLQEAFPRRKTQIYTKSTNLKDIYLPKHIDESSILCVCVCVSKTVSMLVRARGDRMKANKFKANLSYRPSNEIRASGDLLVKN